MEVHEESRQFTRWVDKIEFCRVRILNTGNFMSGILCSDFIFKCALAEIV